MTEQPEGNGRVRLSYQVPFTGGHLSLAVEVADVAELADTDQQFLLDIMDRVAEFAEAVGLHGRTSEVPDSLRDRRRA
jgi:hypothetical protein